MPQIQPPLCLLGDMSHDALRLLLADSCSSGHQAGLAKGYAGVVHWLLRMTARGAADLSSDGDISRLTTTLCHFAQGQHARQRIRHVETGDKTDLPPEAVRWASLQRHPRRS